MNLVEGENLEMVAGNLSGLHEFNEALGKATTNLMRLADITHVQIELTKALNREMVNKILADNPQALVNVDYSVKAFLNKEC